MENTGRYEIDRFGNQIYPPSPEGGERYLKNGKFDVMAKKRDFRGNIHPYFANDKDGNPICPFLKEGMKYLELNIPYPKRGNKELYPKLDNKEYYIGVNENCKYARDENNQEYYARFMNEFYYAFKRNQNGDLVDFPIENQQREAIYILFVDKIEYPLNWPERRVIYPADSKDFVDRILYPLNWTKRRVIYPVDSSGNEYYLENRGKQYYGHLQLDITALCSPIYAKNKLGDDILALDKKIPYYAFTISKCVKISDIYPETKNRRQFYLRQNNKEIYAKRNKKGEIYAKTENRNDYFAVDETNISYYAADENNIEIYPSTQLGENIYRVENSKERVAENKKSKQGFYAKDRFLNEFYPKQFVILES